MLPGTFKTDQIAMLFEEAASGALWIGAYAGLFRYADGAIKPYSIATDDRVHRAAIAKNPDYVLPGILHARAGSMIADREAGWWLATNAGLHYVDPNLGFRVVPGIKGRPTNLRSVIQAKDGSLWGCASNLVLTVRGQERIAHDASNGFTTDRALHLYEDSAGSIWATSEGDGLLRYKEGRWKIFTARDGLLDDFTSNIIEDDLGFLWIGTARGMLRIQRSAFDDFDAGRISTLSPQVFTKFDGMPVAEISNASVNGAAKTRDGRLLFATDLGVAYVDPKRISPNPRPPVVHIERMHVSGKPVQLDDGLRIEPSHSDVQFEYTAISLAAPEKVRFKVRLLPIESDWHDTGVRRDIRYTRLPYGKYSFEVIAGNSDDIWNEVVARRSFIVVPFFYQTWWFRAAVIAFSGLLIFAIVRWRLKVSEEKSKALARQNVELEKGIAERTAELAKSYDALRSSEYFYHSLVESLPWIIVRKSADGRFTYANSAFSELIGRPVPEIIGKTDAEVYPPDRAAKSRADDLKVMESRQAMEYENIVERPGAPKKYLHVKKVPLYDTDNKSIGVQVLFWDMTVFRETEEKLKEAQRELIETSRLAGIAEVATGVLHNIGNALNSVNTSASVIEERIRDLKLPSLSKVVKVLLENQERLAEFLTMDSRGRQFPSFLEKLSGQLEADRSGMLEEVEDLRLGIEQLREIVAAQQGHARVSDASEVMSPIELVEYALRLSDSSLSNCGVTVVREFMTVPSVSVQRQKALQVLVNLLRNASQAMDDNSRGCKQLTVGVRLSPAGLAEIRVTDNGIGIAPENLTRIFGFGFTTKKDGHGFGLHTSALAVKEMGGSLLAESAGLGKGATFILALPVSSDAIPAPTPNPSVDAVPA